MQYQPYDAPQQAAPHARLPSREAEVPRQLKIREASTGDFEGPVPSINAFAGRPVGWEAPATSGRVRLCLCDPLLSALRCAWSPCCVLDGITLDAALFWALCASYLPMAASTSATFVLTLLAGRLSLPS